MIFYFYFDIAANFNPRFGSRALTLCISSQALQAMPAPISNEPMDPNGKGLKIQNQNIPKHTKTLAVECCSSLEPLKSFWNPKPNFPVGS